MNGRHPITADAPNQATNLMSYNDTPLEPLLPLVSRPRPRDSDAPPRHVVMDIDSSGSMAGDPILREQLIATYIIDNLLRPQDTLDVCAFTTSALELAHDQRMTPAGKKSVIDSIRSLRGDGGTEPEACLQLIAGRKLPNCGLIFMSDGYFNQITTQRPDCRMTAFAVRVEPIAIDDPIRFLADPIPAPPGFDPRRIQIPYFDQRPVDRYFEPEGFTPLPVGNGIGRGERLAVPKIPLPGTATTYVKAEADLIAVRPKLTDPVLAYNDAGSGSVGEFTTTLPPEWVTKEDGREAIRRWIAEILPASERRRYLVRVVQHGPGLELEISLAPRAGRLPVVERLTVRLEMGGVPAGEIPVRRDETVPGLFRGPFSVPSGRSAAAGSLLIREAGPDALPRVQRLPLLVPPAGEAGAPLTREAYTYGLNEALLRLVASAGGGSYDSLDRADAFRVSTGDSRIQPLWPALALAGCGFYLLAVLVGRLDL
jgi:hypothetical protein